MSPARSAEIFQHDFRSTFLSRDHYAGKWVVPEEGDHNSLADINGLGREYGMAPDSVEREDLLLRIQEKFHPYLMKYLRMIVHGTVPSMGTRAGNESVTFLKMLHLAFKGDTTEEIYDTLVVCFMSACRRFDPHYADKTRQACEAINGLPKQFTLEQINARVPFDCSRILPSLTRKGFLTSVTGKKKVVAYKKHAWPPPKKFFQSGPVGFVYVAQVWFRYFLNEYIVHGMSQLESGDNVLQLDGLYVGPDTAPGTFTNNPEGVRVAVMLLTSGPALPYFRWHRPFGAPLSTARGVDTSNI